MLIDKIKNIPYFKMLHVIWKIDRNCYKRQLLIYLLFALSVIVNSLSPLLYKWVIDKIQIGTEVLVYLMEYFFALVILKVIEWLLYYPSFILQRKQTFTSTSQHLLQMFKAILNQSILWHKKEHCGVLQNKMRKSYDGLKDFFMDEFIYMRVILRLLCAISFMIYFVPLFGLLALLLGIIAMYITSQLDIEYGKYIETVNKKEHTTFAFISDALHNHKTIKAFNVENSIMDVATQRVSKVCIPFMSACQSEFKKIVIVDFIIVAIYITITGGFILQSIYFEEKLIIGTLVALVAYANNFTSVFMDFTWLNTLSTNSYTNYKAYDISDSNQIANNASSTSSLLQWEIARIKNLKMKDNTQTKDFAITLLKDTPLSFSFRKNSNIAIIGTSGIGKSTLLYLLKGLYEVSDSASFYLDNNSYPFKWLENNSVLGLQDSEIFNGTILYNITLGLPVNMNWVKEVCSITCFDEVLKNKGIDYTFIINPNGENLSGGEKQRLILTRNIYLSKNSSIIFLDEPTSNLDPYTENKIIKNILSMHKTFIITIHKYELLSYFDRIIQLNENGIIFDGTYTNFIENMENNSKNSL